MILENQLGLRTLRTQPQATGGTPLYTELLVALARLRTCEHSNELYSPSTSVGLAMPINLRIRSGGSALADRPLTLLYSITMTQKL